MLYELNILFWPSYAPSWMKFKQWKCFLFVWLVGFGIAFNTISHNILQDNMLSFAAGQVRKLTYGLPAPGVSLLTLGFPCCRNALPFHTMLWIWADHSRGWLLLAAMQCLNLLLLQTALPKAHQPYTSTLLPSCCSALCLLPSLCLLFRTIIFALKKIK